MPYAATSDIPSTPEIYRTVRAKLGEQTPKGLMLHVAVQAEHGLRHIDVWESKADFDRFSREQLAPAVAQTLGELGITPPAQAPEWTPLDLVGIWVP